MLDKVLHIIPASNKHHPPKKLQQKCFAIIGYKACFVAAPAALWCKMWLCVCVHTCTQNYPSLVVEACTYHLTSCSTSVMQYHDTRYVFGLHLQHWGAVGAWACMRACYTKHCTSFQHQTSIILQNSCSTSVMHYFATRCVLGLLLQHCDAKCACVCTRAYMHTIVHIPHGRIKQFPLA